MGFCLTLQSSCPRGLVLPDNEGAIGTLLKGCSFDKDRAYLCRRFARQAQALPPKPVRVGHCPGIKQVADYLSRSDGILYPTLTWVASVTMVSLDTFWSSH